jgi:regulator of sirC expression with transglutaminase-like and TPR domain
MSLENEIKALVNLLDDTDKEVLQHVKSKILSYGEEIVPMLEDLYLESEKPIREKLDVLIYQLQNKNLSYQLEKWANSGAYDLLEGIYHINKIGYPNLKKKDLEGPIDKIKLDIWLELHNTTNPMDQVRVINHVLYQVNRFKGDPGHLKEIDSNFLNKVLELRTGNPVSLGIIYCIVAQMLNIPVFGVNLPHYFIIVYKELVNKPDPDQQPNKSQFMNPKSAGEELFYINAFNNGTIFSRWNIDRFLKQLNLEPRSHYYKPCSNIEIALRVLRNLNQAYEKRKNYTKQKYVNSLIAILQPYTE